jgi:diguanylate cyclase (GGDEF)-like protein
LVLSAVAASREGLAAPGALVKQRDPRPCQREHPNRWANRAWRHNRAGRRKNCRHLSNALGVLKAGLPGAVVHRMFWNRNGSRSPVTTSEAKLVATPKLSDPPAADFDRALDTLRAVLRIFGDHAFDTERATAVEVKEQCTELIRRVILGDNRGQVQGDEDEGTEQRGVRRDWGSVHRYLNEQRTHEYDYVTTSFGNLRHALCEFAQCLTAAVTEDRSSDKNVDAHLTRLMTAAVGSDTDVVRREALLVSEAVRQAISRRRDRETQQLLQLGKQVRLLRQELEQTRARASLDPLTQLYNRAAFDDEIDKVARLGLLLGSEPCLIMVDVDHFKEINDKCGHPSGDAVLKAVADNLVRHFLRREDFVTRYGGEEFAIVVRDSTLEKVAERAERARDVLAHASITTPAGSVNVRQSAGVAVLVPGESASSWIDRADKALYAAKNAGRNRVEIAPTSPSSAPAAPAGA